MTTMDVLPEQDLLSLEEAAEFLCVSKSTMYRLLDQGKLRGMKAGKQWRFRREELLDYMQRGPAALALANLSMPVLDAELAFLGAELEKAGATADAYDDLALEGEAGKIAQLVRRMVGLISVLRGSDIHLNPVWEADGLTTLLILRVDGALREIRRLPYALHDALVMEWKRQAELVVEDRQHPQDGRAHFAAGIALRVATIPTIYGEKVTARTIPTRIPSLVDLGIEQTLLAEWSHKQRGLILFTGPTGSGKSTTEAAFVREIQAQRSCNIMMVAYPDDYIFPHGVTHVKVADNNYAEGMRAVLYHDPDVIIVGELRSEPECAQLAVSAAETGHLVMTVMHAHDAITPLFDILDMGARRLYLANNLIGVCQQQLAPKPCPECMVKAEPEPALLEKIRYAAIEGGYQLPDDATFYNPAGCDKCHGRGYGGRLALHEFFTFTPALRSAFLQGDPLEEFICFARQEGQLSFFAAQVKQAMAGRISLDTLVRYMPY